MLEVVYQQSIAFHILSSLVHTMINKTPPPTCLTTGDDHPYNSAMVISNARVIQNDGIISLLEESDSHFQLEKSSHMYIVKRMLDISIYVSLIHCNQILCCLFL